jgi:hypothetical protein
MLLDPNLTMFSSESPVFRALISHISNHVQQITPKVDSFAMTKPHQSSPAPRLVLGTYKPPILQLLGR